MRKVKLVASPKAMQAIESSRFLLEFNYNRAMRPDDGDYILKMIREEGHCPERKTLSDLATVVASLSLVDGFIEDLAQASWNGQLLDSLTFDAEGNATDEFDGLETREVELDDGLAEGILAKARLLEWSAFKDGPDLEWLLNVLIAERHNEAHNAILEFQETLLAMLRKEGLLV